MTPIIPNKNTTSAVILLLIVAFGFIAGYFFYSQNPQDKTANIPPSRVALDDSLVKFRTLKLNFSAFDDLTFKTLRIFGESPVLPGTTGRADIFAPF